MSMRIVQVPVAKPRPKKKTKRKLLVVLLLLVLTAGTVNYARPLPMATLKLQLPAVAAAVEPSLNWPAGGQAAVGASGYGVLASYGAQTPLATASIAKIITALCVLQKYPLASGQTGPVLTMNTTDVALYDNYVAVNGSRMAVTLGEQLTEYQALQALLLPSANNIADSLAIWAFGSLDAYATYANQFLAAHGLVNTHVGSDASGFDASTTSTATDLVQLGLLALDQPALMEIAGQTSANLPVVGRVANYNSVLGEAGIDGLKTGNNDEDPGAFLFTASVMVDGTKLPVVGVVMGASDLNVALNQAPLTVNSLSQAFGVVTIAQAGSTIGSLQTAWGTHTDLVADHAVQLVRYKGSAVKEQQTLHPASGLAKVTVGSVSISTGQMEAASAVKIVRPANGPSFWWRLTRH